MRRSESMELVAFWSAVSLMKSWADDDHYAVEQNFVYHVGLLIRIIIPFSKEMLPQAVVKYPSLNLIK